MYIIHEAIVRNVDSRNSYYSLIYYGTSLILVGLFFLLIMKVERKEFARFPFIGKYFESTVGSQNPPVLPKGRGI